MLLGRIGAERQGNATLEKKKEEEEENPNPFLRMASPSLSPSLPFSPQEH